MMPVLFSLGPINVYGYGAMVAIGLLLAVCVVRNQALKNDLPAERIIDLLFWIIIAGLLGGRLLYVSLHFPEYSAQPLEMLKLYRGGLSFHGSLIAGILTAFYGIRKFKLPLPASLDVFFLAVPLAHAMGRIGCFLNGCCYGIATQHFFGVCFPGSDIVRHPTQLYSALLLFLLFGFLWRLSARKIFQGQITAVYCILYGGLRFGLEMVRGDNPAVLGGLSLFQLFSIALCGLGIFLYATFRARKKP